MKKQLLIAAALFFSVCKLNAQEDEFNAIKLFVDPKIIAVKNSYLKTTLEDTSLNQALQDRLYRKITQLITQTGTAEIGYSTFLVVPVFDILSTSFSETGTLQVHLAECELNIAIQRTGLNAQSEGGATFNTYSKTIIGSGSNKKEAISNAINSISVNNNKDLVIFFKDSKQKIDAYFNAHCADVIKEARQALELKTYQKAIALFFSVPTSAPCYNEASDAAQRVYATYIEDECNQSIVNLKSYIALAQNIDGAEEKKYYAKALNILENLSPAAVQCYQEARLLIEKIEKRLDEKQKQEWEFLKKMSTDEKEVKKAMYKAMGKINSTYQPGGPSTNVIIAR